MRFPVISRSCIKPEGARCRWYPCIGSSRWRRATGRIAEVDHAGAVSVAWVREGRYTEVAPAHLGRLRRRSGVRPTMLARATRPATLSARRPPSPTAQRSDSNAPRSCRSSLRCRRCRSLACGARRRRSPSGASTSTSCRSTSASAATNGPTRRPHAPALRQLRRARQLRSS